MYERYSENIALIHPIFLNIPLIHRAKRKEKVSNPSEGHRETFMDLVSTFQITEASLRLPSAV